MLILSSLKFPSMLVIFCSAPVGSESNVTVTQLGTKLAFPLFVSSVNLSPPQLQQTAIGSVLRGQPRLCFVELWLQNKWSSSHHNSHSGPLNMLVWKLGEIFSVCSVDLQQPIRLHPHQPHLDMFQSLFFSQWHQKFTSKWLISGSGVWRRTDSDKYK